MEALVKIYDAHRVARELTGKEPVASPPRLLPDVVLEGHTNKIRHAAFSPDGGRIVTASDDETARLWDIEGKPLAVLAGHTNPVYRAAFSPDGSRILTVFDDGTARVYRVPARRRAMLYSATAHTCGAR